MWIYNPFIGQLVFVIVPPKSLTTDGSLLFGDTTTGDINLDTGDRTNDTSLVDNGSRVIAQ
jgi:hypothetical protein